MEFVANWLGALATIIFCAQRDIVRWFAADASADAHDGDDGAFLVDVNHRVAVMMVFWCALMLRLFAAAMHVAMNRVDRSTWYLLGLNTAATLIGAFAILTYAIGHHVAFVVDRFHMSFFVLVSECAIAVSITTAEALVAIGKLMEAAPVEVKTMHDDGSTPEYELREPLI